MYKKELTRMKPEQAGISSERLLRFVQDLEAVTEMHGIMIICQDNVILEGWWKPYTKDLAHICHSIGKTYVSTAIGLACNQGLISIDDRIVDLFREECKEYGVIPDENLSVLQIKHLLTMTNGMGAHPKLDENFIKNYLTEPIIHRPGTRFAYNTAGTSMLGAIITKITGKGVFEYMSEQLFWKTGIETDKISWMKYKNGIDASPGIASSLENNARLGLLYLRGGNWEGEQLLDPLWVKNATTSQIQTAGGENTYPDANAGYGYQIWMNRNPGSYRFDGGRGQLVMVSEENEMIIAINQSASMPSQAEKVMDLLNDFLTEDLITMKNNGTRQENNDLNDYLAALALKPEIASRRFPQEDIFEGIYRIKTGEFHIYPETRPDNVNNWDRAFYSMENEFAGSLSIRYINPMLVEILIDDFSRLEVHLDGKLVPCRSKNAMDPYTISVSTGYFSDENRFVINTRWLHTCPTTEMVLTINKNRLQIEVVKTTLHDASPEIKYSASAERVI